MANTKRRLQFQHYFEVKPRGLSGVLCLFLSDKVEVRVLHSSPNVIHNVVVVK